MTADEMRAAILNGFDISEEEWAAFEASPQHQSCLAAKAAAEADRAAWIEWASTRTAELAESLHVSLDLR